MENKQGDKIIEKLKENYIFTIMCFH